MKSRGLENPGTIPVSYTYDVSQPTYFTEWLSWWYLKQIEDLKGVGWQIFQQESNEFNSLKTDITTWLADLTTWFDDSIAARDLGNPIPAFPTLPTLPTDGRIEGSFISIVVKLLLPSLLTQIRKKMDSTTEAGEVADVLKEALLDPDNSNSTLWKAFIEDSPQSIGDTLEDVRSTLNVINNQLALFRKLFEVTPDSGLAVLKEALLNSSSDPILEDLGAEFILLRKLFEVIPDGGESILKTAFLSATDDSLIDALAAVGLHIQIEPQGIFVTYSDQS